MNIQNKLTPHAVFFILLYALSYAGLWASVRSLSQDFHPLMLVFIRTLFGALMILPLFLKSGVRSLQTKQLPLNLLRGILSITTVSLTFFALSHIPLADAVAYSYLTPIFALMLALFFLRDHLTLKQIAAVFIAFIGAMVLLRPGFQTFNIGVLASLGAALCFAGTLTCMKILTHKESPKLVTIYGYLIPLPISLTLALAYWQWPSGVLQWMMVLLMSLLSVIAHLSMTQALSRADMSMLLPFDFIRLIFAAALGAVLFQDQFDWISFMGGAIILVASVVSSRQLMPKN